MLKIKIAFLIALLYISIVKQLESKLQSECVRWFDYQYTHLKMNLFSIPNEGARTPANGARMKAQGRRAGVADMFFAHSSYMSNGLFIEFKSEKGKQNDNQKAFEKAVTTTGYKYVVINSLEQFKETIENYLNNG